MNLTCYSRCLEGFTVTVCDQVSSWSAATVGDCSVNNGYCSQICTENNGEVECSCRNGYKLSPDKRSCLFNWACEYDNGGCADICYTNADLEPVCDCRDGLTLTEDDKGCTGKKPNQT